MTATKTPNKIFKEALGLPRDTVREMIVKLAKGAEETSSMITFLRNGWKYEFSFEDGICKEAGARKLHYAFHPVNPRPDMVKMIHGRKGQPTEFVQFRPYNNPTCYAAQKSGEFYYVFILAHGGSVKTNSSHTNPRDAELEALRLALEIAQL